MTDVPYTPKAPTLAARAVAVTKSDATVYDPPLNGLWIGGTGNVAVKPAGQDDAVSFLAVPAGNFLPVVVSMVLSTGTSATGIVGLR